MIKYVSKDYAFGNIPSCLKIVRPFSPEKFSYFEKIMIGMKKKLSFVNNRPFS